MGGYPDLNRELTVPHTVALPIELYPPNKKKYSLVNISKLILLFLFRNDSNIQC